MAYTVLFTEDAKRHLRNLPARDRRLIIDAIYTQLLHQATVQTRNRKPMRPNSLSQWALRIGRWRVYYDVHIQPDEGESRVEVLAIGKKIGNAVWIDGERVDL